MARGGAEAHRGSALTAEGTRELIPGATGRAMKRNVLRDDEARAKGFISDDIVYLCAFAWRPTLKINMSSISR